MLVRFDVQSGSGAELAFVIHVQQVGDVFVYDGNGWVEGDEVPQTELDQLSAHAFRMWNPPRGKTRT